MKAVIPAIRAALAAVFLYSGIIKAGAGEQFAMALVPFTILPPEWIRVFAVVLPWTEIVAGLLILLPRVYRAGSAVIILLCAIFIGALSWALATGLIVDCACFGADEAPSASKMLQAVARDAILLLLAAATLVAPRPPARP